MFNESTVNVVQRGCLQDLVSRNHPQDAMHAVLTSGTQPQRKSFNHVVVVWPRRGHENEGYMEFIPDPNAHPCINIETDNKNTLTPAPTSGALRPPPGRPLSCASDDPAGSNSGFSTRSAILSPQARRSTPVSSPHTPLHPPTPSTTFTTRTEHNWH